MIMPDGSRSPTGYLKWTKTWITHEYERPGALWGINRKNYSGITIPQRAYADNEEKLKIEKLVETLKSIDNEILSVSVISKTSATYADAYSTAFNAMGLNRAIEMANNKNIAIMKLPHETTKTLKTETNNGVVDTSLKVRRQFTGTTNSSASASGKDQTKALRLDKKNVFQCDSSLALN